MTTSAPRTAAASLRRWTALLVAAAAAAALLAVTAPAPAASAADETDSSITVAWAGGNDESVQQYQPDHAALTSDGNGNDAGSGHWDDFEDLTVTVSKTQGLSDEVINVSATGLPATEYNNFNRTSGNYLQMMQCWGPDPLADDFWETCQYGGRDSDENLYTTVGPDVRDRGVRPGTNALGTESIDNRFRAVTGEVSTPYWYPNAEADNKVGRNGLDVFFSSATSNEQPFVPFDSAGKATVRFETQSAASQPYLGCGDTSSAAGNRCWLVIVPRGTHSGTWQDDTTSGCGSFVNGAGRYGETTGAQNGSPVDPDCSFFQDRIVIPLDFDDTSSGCAAGAAERRVVGTEFIAAAFSSWQPALCAGGGSLYSLTTNSGNLNRSQLLTGQADFAAVVEPATADTIGTADPALLDEAELAYAPLANTALTIGFVLQTFNGTYTDIRLTPRLIAKLLTQTYDNDIPWYVASYDSTTASRAGRTFAQCIMKDPEWLALGNPAIAQCSRGALVTTGPAGDDATRQLWEYVQADADAVAFLRGEADPWGQTVNPYYLPATNPAAVGGGLDYDLASEPIDSFLRADQTLAPTDTQGTGGQQFDSVGYMPYATTFEVAAQRVTRMNNYVISSFNKSVPGPLGKGDFAYSSPALPGSDAAVFSPITWSDAVDYQLATASLALPLAEQTTEDTVASARHFVAPTDDTVTTAIEGARADENTGTSSLDFGSLPHDAYPLSFTVSGAVDLASTSLDDDAAAEYAGLLTYAAGDGQTRGDDRGQLPAGYVPLTDTQRSATLAVAAALLARTSDDDPSNNPGGTDGAGDTGGVTQGPGAEQATVPAQSGDPQTRVTTADALTADQTASLTAPGAVLGGALVAGVAGLATAPFLLRRRDVGG